MLLIKGTVGPHFVVACVNGELMLTVSGRAQRVAVSDCQRMIWNPTAGRWQIGPGVEPVAAPSAWPGSQVSYDAGWKVIEYVG